ncbi:MAG: RNA polymerase sigma factor [Vicinamibacterales bacterium]
MSEPGTSIESIFRSKYAELCASLLNAFGYERFDLIEDALQSAFRRALERWAESGVPDNPAGWLYTAARNACLEDLRHRAVVERTSARVTAERSLVQRPDEELEQAVAGGLDDLAAMILLCCNPDLSERAHLCLMLRAGCGLSVGEIGRLLGMADEAVKKTITRAKARVAGEADAFHAFDQQRIAARFPVVMETVYALFTEGYAASSGERPLRRDVAAQAVHLCDVLLASRFTPERARGELCALTALMLLQLARFDARVGEDGVPVRLQEQDRSAWNQSMIRAGLDALSAARASETLSAYHLEARIAAEHSTSPSFELTNWPRVLELYDQLLVLKDTSAVRLNRIVALRHARGPMPALEQLDALAVSTPLPGATAFLRHTIRADILESLGRTDEARQSWQAAVAAAPTHADRVFVTRRADSRRVDVPAERPRASS